MIPQHDVMGAKRKEYIMKFEGVGGGGLIPCDVLCGR